MAVSYKKLLHMLIDKNMTVSDLQRQAGYSANISTRLRNDTYISLESVEKSAVSWNARWMILLNLCRMTARRNNL